MGGVSLLKLVEGQQETGGRGRGGAHQVKGASTRTSWMTDLENASILLSTQEQKLGSSASRCRSTSNLPGINAELKTPLVEEYPSEKEPSDGEIY